MTAPLWFYVGWLSGLLTAVLIVEHRRHGR
jgi:hypothetical protein